MLKAYTHASLERDMFYAGHRPNAVCVQWTVAITNHERMSLYLTVNDVCRCKSVLAL